MGARGHVISMSDYYGAEGASTGGAGFTALRIADMLRAAGVDLEVIAGFAYPPERRSESHVTFLGGTDLRVTSQKSPSALAAGLWNETARHGVRSRLQERDASESIVMLHQWTRFLSPAVLSAISSFRQVIYVHDYFWACPTGSYFNYRTNAACDLTPMGAACLSTACDRVGAVQKGYRVVRELLKHAVTGESESRRLFIHISDRSRHFYEALFPRSSHATIYHSVGSVPAPVSVPFDFDVGYFGRLEAEKGVIELAAAAERTGTRCLFVGSGSKEAEVRQRYPQATILDWEPRGRVFELMRSCRAVVLPSLWLETWGSSVPEALSQSVPVLVSNRAGSSELVAKFGGGVIFDPASPASFDDAILRAIADRASLSHAARRAFVAARLDQAAYVENYVALIRDNFGIELLDAAPILEHAR